MKPTRVRLPNRLALSGAVLVAAIFAGGCSPADPHANDEFWSFLSYTSAPVEEYGSVADMAVAADLVVLGSIQEVSTGRWWGPEGDPTAQVASIAMQIQVTDVLAGTMPDGTGNTITVERSMPGYGPDALSDVLTPVAIKAGTDELVGIDKAMAIWFLRDRKDFGTETGVTASVEYVGGTAYRLVANPGVVTEGDNGTADTPLVHHGEEDPDHPDVGPPPLEELIAEEVDETGFDGILETVRLAVG